MRVETIVGGCMTKNEAVDYCYRHKEEYIRGSETVHAGIRSFYCLIAILEDGTIQPSELADYGMEYSEGADHAG